MYSKKNYNLNELPDFVSILKNDLNISKVALGWISLPLGTGHSFLHSHKEQVTCPHKVYLGSAIRGQERRIGEVGLGAEDDITIHNYV